MSQATASASTAPRTDTAAHAPAKSRSRLRLLRPILMLGGIAIVAVASLTLWLTGGRFVHHGSKPLSNLFLSLADQAGVTGLERFGDSTARLADV